MNNFKFVKLCKVEIAKYYDWSKWNEDDIYVVWLNRTLQNNKALLSTSKPDGMYFELTYDGNKHKLYFDAYKRILNKEIPTSN